MPEQTTQSETKMLGVHIPRELHDEFSKIANEYNCSKSRLLKILVEDFVKNKDNPTYTKFIRII